MITITRSPPRTCSVQDIESLERGIGSHLPRDYVSFLLRTNGGYCGGGEDDIRPVFDFRVPTIGREETAPIAVMYSFGLNDTRGTVFEDLLLSRDRMARADPPMPEEMIPIGHADNFWVITLGVAGRFRDGVYLNMSRHDLDWDDILLARSFAGFEAMVTQRVV